MSQQALRHLGAAFKFAFNLPSKGMQKLKLAQAASL
jgi:hypothetical protein